MQYGVHKFGTFSLSLPESYLIFTRYDSNLKYIAYHNLLSSFFFLVGFMGSVMDHRPQGLQELFLIRFLYIENKRLLFVFHKGFLLCFSIHRCAGAPLKVCALIH